MRTPLAAALLSSLLLVGCQALPSAQTAADNGPRRASEASQAPAASVDPSLARIAEPSIADGGSAEPPDTHRSPDGGLAGSEAEAGDASVPAPPLVVPTPIEDPTGRALESFHAALSRAESGAGQARIVFYGASHVASDLYTDVIRQKLQARFGDAGVGFVLPAAPFPFYRNAGVAFEKSVGFRGVRVKARTPLEDRYGLAGVYLTTRRNKPAWSAFTTSARSHASSRAARFELFYAKQPGGGVLRAGIDGVFRELQTHGKRFETAYEVFDVPDGPHRFELQARGPEPVRVFGVAVERDAPGVVLDTLGIPGSRASTHLLWDDAVYREQLARRRPDLVVLAYGTNEAGDEEPTVTSYEAGLLRVLTRVRESVPEASCLLVGPSDRPVKNPDATLALRPRTAEIVEAQRRVAAAMGCGFFDVVSFMGGPMSMVRWVSAAPPFATQDYVHFTRRGYEELGRVLHDALLMGYPAPSELTASRGTARSP